jgi:16S rRNA G1207 methylase RsmC
MAAQCAGELFRQERAGVRILQRDFLTCSPTELGEFDAVAMNPPFHMRSDIKHIQHALTFLKPGGILAALCLDTHHRETALKPLSSSWERVEAGTFGKEGTQVQTILMTIRK